MSRPSENTVIQFSVQRMVCTGCGVEANANCSCGVAYTPKVVRAAEAIKANPQKSNRAIAEEVGVSEGTVRTARKETAQDYAVEDEPRIGLDGKTRRMPQREEQSSAPKRGKDATRERVLEAIVILSGLPPAAEVAGYFADTDTSILISERLAKASEWLSIFNNEWNAHA